MTDRTNTLQRIQISLLSVDPRIQRPLEDVWVSKLVASFNVESIGALVVSRRPDGSHIIIDGQHREAAARQSGFTGKLPCVVYEGLELADEAALFLTLNNSRKVQAIDRFRVRVVEGDKAAVRMNNVLVEYQWRAQNVPKAGAFSAVTALERVYDGAGTRRGEREDLVRATISVITCSWGHDHQGAHAAIIGGIGVLLARLPRAVNLDRLVTVLSKERPVSLVAMAKQHSAVQSITASLGMASVIHGLYNKNLRSSRLPEWVWTR